jgi:hypothetical protein
VRDQGCVARMLVAKNPWDTNGPNLGEEIDGPGPSPCASTPGGAREKILMDGFLIRIPARRTRKRNARGLSAGSPRLAGADKAAPRSRLLPLLPWTRRRLARTPRSPSPPASGTHPPHPLASFLPACLSGGGYRYLVGWCGWRLFVSLASSLLSGCEPLPLQFGAVRVGFGLGADSSLLSCPILRLVLVMRGVECVVFGV